MSVKTRLGFDSLQTEEWCGFLLEHQLDVLTVHGRIASEMSRFPANWEELHKVVELRNQRCPQTLIIGNGDVTDLTEIDEKHRVYGVDGVMIGRGIFDDLHLFHPEKSLTNLSRQERLTLLVEHAQLFVDTWGQQKDFNILKKFFKIYTAGFDGALPLREELMKQKNLEQVLQVLQEHQHKRFLLQQNLS